MTDEWRPVADRIRTWGRWGADDELGTLNHITAERRARAAGLVRTGRAIPLASPLDSDGTSGPSGIRRNPMHIMTVDGGDGDIAERLQGWGMTAATDTAAAFTSGPFRWNDDWLFAPVQSASHWDALCHGYYEGQMYNGHPASSVTSFGAARDAVDVVARAAGVVGRGVLLDVPRHRGVDALGPGEVVTPEELDAVVDAQGVEVGPGDIVLVRTGWLGQLERLGAAEWSAGTPGVSWRTAEWLAEREVAAIAADNLCVEVLTPEIGVLMLFHMLALRDLGMMLGEIWELDGLAEDCAADGVYEFLLTAPALRITGGSGSSVNPVALK